MGRVKKRGREGREEGKLFRKPDQRGRSGRAKKYNNLMTEKEILAGQ